MQEDIITINLKEFFTELLNHIVAIILVTFAFAIVGFCFTKFLIPEKFEANATMIVNTRQDQNGTVTNDQINSAKQLVTTYAVILKSDTIMEQVIENLNLREIEGWEELTAEDFAKDIVEVAQVDSTQVMRITATTNDADLSADIVTEIVNMAPDMIINTVKAGSVEVISAPKANYEKVAPSVMKNTAICAFLGMVLVVGVVILKKLLDNTFKTDEDITKHIGLTVLGVIPSYKDEE